MYSLCSGHRSGDALSNFSRLIRLSSMQDKSIKQESTILTFFVHLKYFYITRRYIILCIYVIYTVSNLIKQSINIKIKSIEIKLFNICT